MPGASFLVTATGRSRLRTPFRSRVLSSPRSPQLTTTSTSSSSGCSAAHIRRAQLQPLSHPRASRSWWRPLVAGESQLDPERRRALETKARRSRLRLRRPRRDQGRHPGRTRALAVGALAGLRTAEAPGISVKLIKEPSDKFNRVAVPLIWPQVLNVLELVGLLRLAAG